MGICRPQLGRAKMRGLYRFPAFGAAGHVTAGNGSILLHWRTAAQI
jgi:hypothetical protein